MAGRKLGAALITANISQVVIFWKENDKRRKKQCISNEQHILEHFTSKAGNYRPLVYCWRGGQRSRSMALILRWTQICEKESFMTYKYNVQRNRVPSGDLSRRLQRIQATGARDGPGETWMRSPLLFLMKSMATVFSSSFIKIVDIHPTGVRAEQ